MVNRSRVGREYEMVPDRGFSVIIAGSHRQTIPNNEFLCTTKRMAILS